MKEVPRVKDEPQEEEPEGGEGDAKDTTTSIEFKLINHSKKTIDVTTMGPWGRQSDTYKLSPDQSSSKYLVLNPCYKSLTSCLQTIFGLSI